MWSQGDSRSGGSDNDLPPRSPVCECRRESVFSVCLMMWMDRILSKQIMGVMSQPLQAINGKANPISPFLGLYFLHLVHPNARIHVCILKTPIIFIHMWINLHISVCTALSVVFTLIRKHSHACIHPFTQSETPSYLQAPRYHCCDDLLNGKWYHA